MFFIVNHLKKNKIIKAYVFAGKEHNYKSMYKNNKHDDIFEGQLDMLSLHNVPIEFVSEQIYIDDRIGIVKYKIASVLNIAMEEIYLFGTEHQVIQSIELYKILTQDNTLPLDKNTLQSFLSNVEPEIRVPTKSKYDYNDVYELGLDGIQVVKMPIGQQISSTKRHLFTVNPFEWTTFVQDEVYDTNNKTLLMEFLPLQHRMYLCKTEDVLEYALSKEMPIPIVLSLYYPFLKDHGIVTLETYHDKREKIRELTYTFLTNHVYQHIQESVDLLYHLDTPIPKLISGITQISIQLEKKNHIPLELIFKLINTHEFVPITIYNPGKNKENIIRLFADKMTTNGQMIPYLQKSQIFTYLKTIAHGTCVAIVVGDMVCNFMEDGSIIIDVEKIDPISIVDLTEKIKMRVNPIITNIVEFIQQSGYTYPLFTTLYECKIIHMNYESRFNSIKNLTKHIRSYTGCISSVFNIDAKYSSILRYKKVSNFNEVSSKVAYIITSTQQNVSNEDIIQGLQDNFNITAREATQELVKYANEFKTPFLNQDKSRMNTGFKTVISTERGTNHTTISIQDINNIHYLEVMPTYITALYNLTQQVHGTYMSEVSRICNVASKEEVVLNDVVHEYKVEAIGYEEDYEDIFNLDDMEGGSSSPTIIGARLKSPNYFQERLMSRDSKLFLKKKDGKYNAYSRVCPFSNRRQPVVVNQEELDHIDKESPGSYTDVFPAGSTDEKKEKNMYICPRYWCMTKGISLTEEQVKEGKICGTKIISQNATSVPKDAYIYEFTDKTYHKKNGQYVTMHPGGLNQGTHPEGYSVPCCFKTPDSKLQKERREKIVKAPKVSEQYLMGPEKVPIPFQRWGDLPVQVQRFFHFNNSTCYSGSHTREIKKEHQCILRKGVEETNTQSFIACIADLYSHYQTKLLGKKIQLKLKEFKDILVHALTLELFISLQNGYLIEVFNRNDFPDHTPYLKTKLYKTLQQNPLYLNHIISAYDTFKAYIQSEDKIEHVYLWDFISLPNPNLFIEGVNLILLDIPEDDISNNVEMICPSNSYSIQKFTPARSTLILYRKYGFFEPIYVYQLHEQELEVSGLFKMGDIPNVDRVLTMAEDIYKYECNPKSSSCSSIYPFKQNIVSLQLIQELRDIEYDIVHQVLNFNNKCIGIVAKHHVQCMIPCYPSAIQAGISILYIDEDIWKDYSTTVSFLSQVHTLTSGKIPCKPVVRTLEDGLVFGILTETNQLVLLDSPQENTMKDELIVYETINEYTIDKLVLNEPTIDYERDTYVKRIKVEGQFYNAYRNMIRNQLHTPDLYMTKLDLVRIVESSMNYNEKYERIRAILKEFMYRTIEFVDGLYTDLVLSNIETITNCNTDCEKKPYCFTTEDSCKMIIPKYHLLSNLDNEIIYVGRLTDEFIRYPHIQQFMLKNTFLSLQATQYNLLPTEMILLKSMIDQDWFDRLNSEPLQKNYLSNFDITNPLNSLQFAPIKSSSFFNIEEEVVQEQACIQEKIDKIRGHKWSSMFSGDSYELIYKAEEACTFCIIQDIIQDHLNETVSISTLKSQLFTLYTSYPELRVVQILYEQGKRKLFTIYRRGEVGLDTVILSEHYYLTSIDIWLLADFYHLPIVLLSGVKLSENNREIILTQELKLNVYFIKISTIKYNEIPGFILYRTSKLGYLYPQLSESMKELFEKEKKWNQEHTFSLEAYLNGSEYK